MKTLLSLTSRIFGKARVRVFYREVEQDKAPEGVQINTHTKVISCTREALSKLGDWCSQTARAFGLTLVVATGANNALAQESPQTESTHGSPQNILVTSITPNTLPSALPVSSASRVADVPTTAKDEPKQPTVSTSAKVADTPEKTPDAKNTLRVSMADMLSMLASPRPPKTVEAIEFLSGLTPEIRAELLAPKKEPNAFDKIYADLNSMEKGTPAPTIEEMVEYLGNKLSEQVGIVLNKKDITPNNLLDISDEDIGQIGTKSPNLLVNYNLYAEYSTKLEVQKATDTEQKLADTEQKLAGTAQKLAGTAQKLAGTAQELAGTQKNLEVTQEKLKVADARLEGWKKIGAILAQANIQ